VNLYKKIIEEFPEYLLVLSLYFLSPVWIWAVIGPAYSSWQNDLNIVVGIATIFLVLVPSTTYVFYILHKPSIKKEIDPEFIAYSIILIVIIIVLTAIFISGGSEGLLIAIMTITFPIQSLFLFIFTIISQDRYNISRNRFLFRFLLSILSLVFIGAHAMWIMSRV